MDLRQTVADHVSGLIENAAAKFWSEGAGLKLQTTYTSVASKLIYRRSTKYIIIQIYPGVFPRI